MTPVSMPLDDLLCQLGETDSDKLKVILERTVQALIEAEVSAVIRAGRHERVEERVTYRNGHRPRVWDTRVGRLELEIPKPRQGSFLPSLLEPRRRIERALWLREAWGRVKPASMAASHQVQTETGPWGWTPLRNSPTPGVATNPGASTRRLVSSLPLLWEGHAAA